MSKQVVVVSGQRSVRSRLVLLVAGIVLVVWFVRSPAEAAAGVKAGWDGFVGAADAFGTLISSLAG